MSPQQRAKAIIRNVESRGQGGIGDERRRAVFAAAGMRSSHKAAIAPALVTIATLLLLSAAILLLSETRNATPVAVVTVEPEPEPILVPELPQDPYAAAIESRAEDLRNRVSEPERPRRLRSPQTKQLRDRMAKLRAQLEIDS